MASPTCPSKIEWDRIPTDPVTRKLRSSYFIPRFFVRGPCSTWGPCFSRRRFFSFDFRRDGLRPFFKTARKCQETEEI